MRQFSHKGFRIEQLSTEAKILYSAFLFFAMAAMIVSILYYGALVGDRPLEGAREYYAGEVPSNISEIVSPKIEESGGPVIDLPETEESMVELRDQPMLTSMTRRKLLEVTHFHLFTLPIFLLVIAHIFMLCSIHPSIKSTTIVSGVVSSGVHMAAPWLVFWGGSAWAWLMPVTGAWMTLSMLVLIVWPAWAMWRPPKPKGI